MIIEKDSAVAEALERFCSALSIDSQLLQTQSNAIRAYTARVASAVFFNPTMNLIDPRSLMEEFGNIARQAGRRPSPVIFTVENESELTRAGLKGHPGTAAIVKPLNIEQLFALFEKLSLTGLSESEDQDPARNQIDEWQNYTIDAVAWVDKLVSQLGG